MKKSAYYRTALTVIAASLTAGCSQGSYPDMHLAEPHTVALNLNSDRVATQSLVPAPEPPPVEAWVLGGSAPPALALVASVSAPAPANAGPVALTAPSLPAAPMAPAETLTAVAEPPAPIWEIYEGEDVTDTFRRWSHQAGYTPLPDFTAKEKWKVIVSQQCQDSFEDCLAWLSRGFSTQAVKPVPVLSPNKTLDVIGVPTGVTAADITQGSFH